MCSTFLGFRPNVRPETARHHAQIRQPLVPPGAADPLGVGVVTTDPAAAHAGYTTNPLEPATVCAERGDAQSRREFLVKIGRSDVTETAGITSATNHLAGPRARPALLLKVCGAQSSSRTVAASSIRPTLGRG